MIGEVVPVAVIAEPDVGVAVTVYPVIAVPPSLSGTVKLTSAEFEIEPVRVETTEVGEPGSAAITMDIAEEVDEIFPAASVAVAVTLFVPAESEAVVHE